MYHYQPGRDKKCQYCGEIFYHTHEVKEIDAFLEIPFLVYSKQTWLTDKAFNFTEEELDNAGEPGFLGIKNNTRCYVSKFIPVVY